jgi:hypothetical protein
MYRNYIIQVMEPNVRTLLTAQVESELSGLELDERKEFLQDLGESALNSRLVH